VGRFVTNLVSGIEDPGPAATIKPTPTIYPWRLVDVATDDHLGPPTIDPLREVAIAVVAPGCLADASAGRRCVMDPDPAGRTVDGGSSELVASGNHDLDGPGPEGEQRASWLSALRGPALYGDGQSVDVDGVRFTVCPWWDGPQTKEIVERQLDGVRYPTPSSDGVGLRRLPNGLRYLVRQNALL
jgi:hypothetical protein